MKREEIANPDLERALAEEEAKIMLSRARRRLLLRRAEQIQHLATLAPQGLIFTTIADMVNVNFWVTVPGFTSEAAPDLLDLIEHLEEVTQSTGESEDDPDSGLRRYRFRSFETGPVTEFTITLWAKLDTASEACQRIVTGKRTQKQIIWADVEVPTYAFKC